jgi:hypothetical protein
MHKKTSTVIGLAIATILTAYISALTVSNQAFARGINSGGQVVGQEVNTRVTDAVTQANVKVLGQEAEVGKILAGHEAQLGKVGHSLGNVCLTCWIG